MRLNWRGSVRAPPHSGTRRGLKIVGPEPAMAVATLDQWVRKRIDVAAGAPNFRVHQDRSVDSDDVIPLTDHGPPPGVLDVSFELYAHRSVVPHTSDAAINLAALKHESPPLGERYKRFKIDIVQVPRYQVVGASGQESN